MNTKPKTNETAAAAAHLAGDPTVETKVQDEIQRSSMVTRLLAMRVAKNVTQDKVAEVMQCDPSKISRLEAGNDTTLKWNDILGYARALDLELTISFADQGLPASARIKHCVYEIHRGLQELATLATSCGADEKITQGIHRFYAEVLFNFLARYKDGLDTLGATMKFPAETATKETEETTQPDNTNWQDETDTTRAEHVTALA